MNGKFSLSVSPSGGGGETETVTRLSLSACNEEGRLVLSFSFSNPNAIFAVCFCGSCCFDMAPSLSAPPSAFEGGGVFEGTRIFAGTPTAVAPGGTERRTTDPAPTLASSPTEMFPRIVAPAPINTFLPSFGCLSPLSFPVPPNVTPCSRVLPSPILAVSPITIPVPWSNITPHPIVAPGWMSTPHTSDTRDCNQRARCTCPLNQARCAAR
mmetsp:Transcript_36272/g.71359  ORF Transcript_36272/g.71359 Transcript_36272/m.71359 type:complete len:211 (+) Transcript_36272:309-941(+)